VTSRTPEVMGPSGLPGQSGESAQVEPAQPQDPDHASGSTFPTWTLGHGPVLAAGSVPPVLYLLFVIHYASNSFWGDDWSVTPVVHAALHGHLTLGELWSQYNESRLFFGTIVTVFFGVANRLDLRSVIIFSALVFIATYIVLLSLLRRYLDRPLRPIPVLSVGVVWFSLADLQNSLWGFQVSWYLTLFGVMIMLFALLVPEDRRRLWLIIAIAAAVAASLSTVQGFLCWPLGAICILWNPPENRHVRWESAVWIGAFVATLVLYLPGYSFNDNGCLPASACSPSVALHHPTAALAFFLALIGNVLPHAIIFSGAFVSAGSAVLHEVLGAVILLVAAFILVQSWRHRKSTERVPLPLLLICFSLAFDVTITLGRGGSGGGGALEANRYVMANLVLLTAIVMYALAHIPALLVPRPTRSVQRSLGWVALAAMTVFLILQVTVASQFGLRNAPAIHNGMQQSARFFLNLDRIPEQDLACESYVELFPQAGALLSFGEKFRDASQDHLGPFQPAAARSYSHRSAQRTRTRRPVFRLTGGAPVVPSDEDCWRQTPRPGLKWRRPTGATTVLPGYG
jgi:hypothetical protein